MRKQGGRDFGDQHHMLSICDSQGDPKAQTIKGSVTKMQGPLLLQTPRPNVALFDSHLGECEAVMQAGTTTSIMASRRRLRGHDVAAGFHPLGGSSSQPDPWVLPYLATHSRRSCSRDLTLGAEHLAGDVW